MSVKNWRSYPGEQIQYITNSGVVFNLDDRANRAIMSMSGWGVPPRGFATSRTPYQGGEVFDAARHTARSIEVMLRYSGRSRDELHEIRDRLNRLLGVVSLEDADNPQEGELRYYRSDGTVRAVKCALEKGLIYSSPSAGQWDMYGITEQLVFIAFDPIIYDPIPTTVTLDAFDVTNPQTFTITYPGSWKSYPIIRITGEMTAAEFSHTELGSLLVIDYTLTGGANYIDIDLRERIKSFFDDAGDNVVGYVDFTQSTLSRMFLAPDPTVADGVNNIVVTVTDPSATTQVDLTYYTLYEGI